jgi:hypothetical protein
MVSSTSYANNAKTIRLGSSTLRFLMGAHLGTASLIVNSTSYANYTVTTPLTGRDQIDILFTNDYYQSPEDRNLCLAGWSKSSAMGSRSPGSMMMQMIGE